MTRIDENKGEHPNAEHSLQDIANLNDETVGGWLLKPGVHRLGASSKCYPSRQA